MKLYYSPGACSLSPRIALLEAGLPFEAIRVDLKTQRTETGDNYLGISPKGLVPALQIDGGDVITEGPAIVQYIADLVPESALAPPYNALERTRLQEWLNFISTEVHRGFSPLWNPNLPDSWRPTVMERLNWALGILNAHLTDNKYLLGDLYSVADCYAFTCVRWADVLHVSLDKFPRLRAYMTRMAERPAVQKALQDEGLLSQAA